MASPESMYIAAICMFSASRFRQDLKFENSGKGGISLEL